MVLYSIVFEMLGSLRPYIEMILSSSFSCFLLDYYY